MSPQVRDSARRRKRGFREGNEEKERNCRNFPELQKDVCGHSERPRCTGSRRVGIPRRAWYPELQKEGCCFLLRSTVQPGSDFSLAVSDAGTIPGNLICTWNPPFSAKVAFKVRVK